MLPQYFHQGEYFHQKPLQQVLDSSYQLRTKNTAQPKTKTEIRLIQCSKVNTAIQFSLRFEERSAEKMLLNATDLILNWKQKYPSSKTSEDEWKENGNKYIQSTRQWSLEKNLRVYEKNISFFISFLKPDTFLEHPQNCISPVLGVWPLP